MEKPNYIKPKGSNRNAPCPCGSERKLKHCCGTGERARALREWCAERALEARRLKAEEERKKREEFLAANPNGHIYRRQPGTRALLGVAMLGAVAFSGSGYRYR